VVGERGGRLWWALGASLLSACLTSPPPPGGGGGPPEASSFSYPAGEHIALGLYQQVDLGQGTIAFWVWPKWDEGPGDRLVLAELAGLRIAVAGEAMVVEQLGGEEQITEEGAIRGWQRDEPHLVVVRWDWREPLASGLHASLRVDGRDPVFGMEAAPIDSAAPGLQRFGAEASDGPGAAIIGLVVARRPIYDARSRTGSYLGRRDEHEDMLDAGPSGDLAEVIGPWDIVFALSRYLDPDGKDGFGGWSHPHGQSLLGEGGVDLGSADWTVDAGEATLEPGIYGGGRSVQFGQLSRTMEIGAVGPLRWGESLIVRAVAHAIGGGQPVICIDLGPNTCAIRAPGAPSSSREEPEELVLAFEVPDDETTSIRVRLISDESGDPQAAGAVWHQIDMQRNRLLDPSFERVQPGALSEPWTAQGLEASEIDRGPPHSGQASLAIAADQGNGTDSARQQPMELVDGEFYAVGGFFAPAEDQRGRVGIVVGNGSLFSHGRPFASREKMRARIAESAQPLAGWFHLRNVGKRLRDGNHNNHNDWVHWGVDSQDEVFVLVDDAYVYRLHQVALSAEQ
jgi:hypothetical protein